MDIIQSLRAYASLPDIPAGGDSDVKQENDEERLPLLQRLGDDFARGHVQASGGIVDVDEFEELMRLMKIGVKSEKKDDDKKSPAKKKAGIDPGQKNTLAGYFGKPAAAQKPKA